MGELEFEAEHRLRRGRRWFVAATLLLLGVLVAAGAWVYGQVPSAVALEPVTTVTGPTAQTLDVRAAMVTDRLAAAAGRTLQSLADEVTQPVANPAQDQAPVVSGAQAASDEFAQTLQQLTDAEAAAAEQLALSKKDVKTAQAERDKAAKDLAKEESAAADAVDAAIAAAISAAQAQTASTPYSDGFAFGGFGGSIPEGSSTNTDEVLALVKKAFPADQVGNAMAVSRCESGHANRVSKPNANGSRDFGVFQINDGGTMQASLRTLGVKFADITAARSKALDPALNVKMARVIWDARGWQPWTCAAKLKIVAGLYQRAEGPMYGKYDEYGRAL